MSLSFQEREYYQEKREENFRNKTPAQIKASIKGHKGQMTKLGKLADQKIEACRALPTKRAIAELEEIKWRLEEKLADLEYGYAKYLAEDPDTEPANNQHITKMQDEYLILSDSILNTLNVVPLTAEPRGIQCIYAKNSMQTCFFILTIFLKHMSYYMFNHCTKN